jgi:uncharacterized protein YdeI (YjbR/CyaY-like superfamily)
VTPKYFRTAAAFRRWLEAHHAEADELVVGYHRKATGRPSLSWSESVDEALCFGWIDGIRRRVDEERFAIRFTPRRPGSRWSRVNVAKAEALIAQGRMRPAGRAAFDARREDGDVGSGPRGEDARLAADLERRFRREPAAWRYFQRELAPGYRRLSIRWVMSAKRESTRRRRLDVLIESSAHEQTIPPLRRSGA